MRATITFFFISIAIVSTTFRSDAFVPAARFPKIARTAEKNGRFTTPVLWYVDSSEMKTSDMKKELESYGISTAALFERNEFERLLKKARLDRNGNSEESPSQDDDRKSKREKWSKKVEDIASAAKDAIHSKAKNFSTETKEKDAQEEESQTASKEDTRQDRYDKAVKDGKKMKLSELKKELKGRGISSSSFFEKEELVKAYATAIADFVQAKTSGTKSNSKVEEDHDPSYRDVVTRIFDSTTIMFGKDIIIDVTE